MGRDGESKVKEVESNEEVRDLNLASLAIDPLPDFTFYTKAKAVIQTTNFAEAFKNCLIKLVSFHKAYHHPDPTQRKKWCKAIRKEFKDMTCHGIWHKVKCSAIPKGQRCIKLKWVFKTKHDSIFCARLVACGYRQIPGVDFTENYAPVMNNVTWHILLVVMIIWKMDVIIINVKTTFLHGELNKEIYMDLPAGLNGDSDKCLLLLKVLYGLVQGTRQWWKKFVKILKRIEFQGGYANPCLLIKRSDDGLVFASIYVDDNFCVRHRQALQQFVKDLHAQGLTVKVSKQLMDYLSCLIQVSADCKSAWIRQPHLIVKLCEKFEHLVTNMQV